MSMNQALMAELKMEAAGTRKMLLCVPMDNSTWKPHDKSMALGRLAAHVAEIPRWITMIMTADVLDFATHPFKSNAPTTTEELVAIHDEKVAEAMATLEKCVDADFDAMWTMRSGDKVYFTMPKKVALRTFAYSHLYHHRGQLSVFLRLLDVAIPGMYGPSADDTIAMKAAQSN